MKFSVQGRPAKQNPIAAWKQSKNGITRTCLSHTKWISTSAWWIVCMWWPRLFEWACCLSLIKISKGRIIKKLTQKYHTLVNITKLWHSYLRFMSIINFPLSDLRRRLNMYTQNITTMTMLFNKISKRSFTFF